MERDLTPRKMAGIVYLIASYSCFFYCLSDSMWERKTDPPKGREENVEARHASMWDNRVLVILLLLNNELIFNSTNPPTVWIEG